MKIIEQNPFRVLGIISNASAKETKESETFILRYLDIGKSANLKFDITPPLNHLERTSEIVKNAKRKIHDDFDKLTYSIFWFLNGSLVDKIALDKLSAEKNIDKASESFKKGSRNFSISKTSFSSILNFSTLEIISYSSHKDEDRLKQAIKYKYEIIKDKIIFKEFEKLITSTTNKINHKDYVDRYLENVKDLLKDIFPRRDQNKLLLDIFSYDNSISEEIEGQITSSLVESINNNLVLYDSFFEKWSDVSDSQIISSKSSFINRSKKLVSDTKSDLNKLKQSVGKNNYQFSNLVNEIYNRVNASVIMCFNKEMDKLNSAIELGTTSTITSTSFKSYVDILEESSKAISSINCSIKSTLNENLKVIRKINGQLLEMKSRNRTSSYGGGSSYSGGSTYSGGSSSTNEEMPAGVWIFGIIIAIIIFSNC
jgi:hypothetical protein